MEETSAQGSPEHRPKSPFCKPPLCEPPIGAVRGSLRKLSRGPSKKSCVSTSLQRAENGGLDPSWLILAFLGSPDFQFRGPKILVLKGFGTSGRKIGAPQKRQIQPRRIQAAILGPLITSRQERKNQERARKREVRTSAEISSWTS